MILDDFFQKKIPRPENTLYHSVYLTRIFNYFDINLRGENILPHEVFNKTNISLMHIPLEFEPYVSLLKKEKRLAREEEKEILQEEEESDGMEAKEVEEQDVDRRKWKLLWKALTDYIVVPTKSFSKIKRSFLTTKRCLNVPSVKCSLLASTNWTNTLGRSLEAWCKLFFFIIVIFLDLRLPLYSFVVCLSYFISCHFHIFVFKFTYLSILINQIYFLLFNYII